MKYFAAGRYQVHMLPSAPHLASSLAHRASHIVGDSWLRISQLERSAWPPVLFVRAQNEVDMA